MLLQSDPNLIFLICRVYHVTIFPDKIQAPFLKKTLHDLPSNVSSHLSLSHQVRIASPPLLFCLPARMVFPVSQHAITYLTFKAQFVFPLQEAFSILSFHLWMLVSSFAFYLVTCNTLL